MGIFSNISTRIREYMRFDKEALARRLAQGMTSNANPHSGFDLLQSYGYDSLSNYLRMEQDLLNRFVEYEEMDDYPELSTAVDIFADDCSQPETQLNRTVWITSPDKTIETLLDDLLHRRLRMDEEVWPLARSLIKYGNSYLELLVTDEGVVGLNPLAPPTVRRIEGPRGELYGFVQDFKGRFGFTPAEFQQILATRMSMITGGSPGNPNLAAGQRVAAMEDWEVVHMRLNGKHHRSIYGFSVLESARWIWKRLMLLEDAALIYRLHRAPERLAYYIDVGDLPPAEAMGLVNRVRQQHRKKKFYNPSTNRMDLKFEPFAQDEDFYIPVRKGVQGTKVETIGSPAWQHMEDIEYFRDKMFAAIKIPKAYLAQDRSVPRAVLSSEDVRFARTVLRIQREIRNGLGKICRVHLAALDLDPNEIEFDVRMTTPSAIFELAQLEVRNARADLASRMQEHVSLEWLLSNVYGLSNDEIKVVFEQREEDKAREAKFQANTTAAVTKAQMDAQADGQAKMAEISAQQPQASPAAQPSPSQYTPPQQVQDSYDYSARHHLPDHNGPTVFRKWSVFSDKEAKMEKLLRNDATFAHKIQELGLLIRELKAASSNNAQNVGTIQRDVQSISKKLETI